MKMIIAYLNSYEINHGLYDLAKKEFCKLLGVA